MCVCADAEDPESECVVPPVPLSGLSFVIDPMDEDKRVLPEGVAPPPTTAAGGKGAPGACVRLCVCARTVSYVRGPLLP